jgi:serine/threonine-protein kinase ATR
MNLATIRAFTRAVKLGSKYVYQAVPRLLTLWLDLRGSVNLEKEYRDVISKCHDQAQKAIREIPAYKVCKESITRSYLNHNFPSKWYIAFPQIVSRVGHPDQETFSILSKLILKVLEEYPKQALWLFASVVKSTKSNREQRGRAILDMLRVSSNSF